LRVIAGTCKGRKLHPVGSLSIRPTADHVRESLFNILVGEMENARVLDLFAGTGGLGIEALSRGARSCLFVDRSRQAIGLIRRNISLCGLADHATVLQKDITRGLDFLKSEKTRFDVVFADPPYERGHALSTLRSLDTIQCMNAGGIVVLEHGAGEVVPEGLTHFKRSDRRRYGKTLVSFYDFVV